MIAAKHTVYRSWALVLLLAMVGGVLLLQGSLPTRAQAQSTVVSTNGPYTGVVGQSITMTGRLSVEGVLVTQWLWSFGDGTSGSGQSVRKVYDSPGTYFVTLRVQTSQGAASATTTARITEQVTGVASALVSAGGPYSGVAGQPITMSGSNLLAGVVPAQWLWDFGDGTSGSGQSVQKTYVAGGTYTVTLQVHVNQGVVSTSTTATISGATTTVSLPSGCTNVAATWPDGTPVVTVVAAVSPSAAVLSVWRSEAGTQNFAAYSPTAPQVTSNLTTVNRFEAVYICTTAPATLTRPVI